MGGWEGEWITLRERERRETRETRKRERGEERESERKREREREIEREIERERKREKVSSEGAIGVPYKRCPRGGRGVPKRGSHREGPIEGLPSG